MAILCANNVSRKKATAGGECEKYTQIYQPNTPHRRCGAEIIFSGNSSSEEGRAGLNTSILISQIVDKLWAKEKRAVQLRQEGNKLFQVGCKIVAKMNRDHSEAGGISYDVM